MKRLLAFVFIVALPGIVTAQERKPPPWPTETTAVYTRCRAILEQIEQGIEPPVIPFTKEQNRLCDCLVAVTPDELTFDEMNAYAEASFTNRRPPPNVVRKLGTVVTQCTKEAKNPPPPESEEQ